VVARAIRRDGQSRRRRLRLGAADLGPAQQAIAQRLGGRPHDDLGAGQPILALDMYEHAYQMDYGAKAGDYVEAFMKAIRWSNADNLYAQHAHS